MMLKNISIFFLVFALPITIQAADKKKDTFLSVKYENVQQLIKNYYYAQEFCKGSFEENAETYIMCNYRDAADEKLNQLGWCFGHDNQPESDKKWIKCKKNHK